MNDFFSNNVLKQNIDSIGTSSNIDNFESNNASNKQPISDDNTELIITKATQNKTSTVSKNGRTISRIHEVISKFNKTIENAEQKMKLKYKIKIYLTCICIGILFYKN